MWGQIDKFFEKISKYSTFAGQVWFIFVGIFRTIVVVTIGSPVYSDEQSAFKCSTKVIGCDNVCYNQFAKISQMRFWSFEILALSFPIFGFYFYTLRAEAKISKLKETEKENEELLKEVEAGDNNRNSILQKAASEKLLYRKKKAGKVVQRKRFLKESEKLEVVSFTKSIYVAYFISVLARIAIEALFLILAYDLYRYDYYSETEKTGALITNAKKINSFWDLFLIRVPQLYRCSGEQVEWACGQHLLPGSPDPYVPCWVSRAWEKTIFLCYMNTVGMVCLILCLIELVQLFIQFYKNMNKKFQRKLKLETEYKQYNPRINPDNNNPDKAPLQASNDITYQTASKAKLPKMEENPEKEKQEKPLDKNSPSYSDVVAGSTLPHDQLRRGKRASKGFGNSSDVSYEYEDQGFVRSLQRKYRSLSSERPSLDDKYRWHHEFLPSDSDQY